MFCSLILYFDSLGLLSYLNRTFITCYCVAFKIYWYCKTIYLKIQLFSIRIMYFFISLKAGWPCFTLWAFTGAPCSGSYPLLQAQLNYNLWESITVYFHCYYFIVIKMTLVFSLAHRKYLSKEFSKLSSQNHAFEERNSARIQ